MARFDQVRQRLELSDHELETLRLINNREPGIDDQTRTALTAAGMVDAEGDIAPLVLDLVQTITDPMIQCVIEVAGPQGPTMANLAIREETIWYTDPWPEAIEADAPTQYYRDELTQLLWVIARLTGLRRAEVPASARPFTVPLRAIDAVINTMMLGDDLWEATQTMLTQKLDQFFSEVPDADRQMVMATVAHLEATARVTMAWGPELTDMRGVAFWNCGDGGYWIRRSPAEPVTADDITPATPARFEPVRGADIWSAFADLVPATQEIERVIARSGADR